MEQNNRGHLGFNTQNREARGEGAMRVVEFKTGHI